MKKQLLATTALAAAGAVALSGAALAQDKKMMKPTLTIKGAYEQNVGFVDSDRDDLEGFHTTSDNEITFAVRTELDNGLIVRGQVELEGNQSTDQVDEAFVAVGGSFGEIRMGANDEAAYEMTFGYQGAISTGAGNYTLPFDVGDWIPGPAGSISGPTGRVNISSDADLIAYYTPRFSGFQFGVSYARTGAEDSDGIEPDNVHDNNIVTFAGNYVGKFGDVGVGLAVGYAASDNVDASMVDPNTTNDATIADTDTLLAPDGREVWGGGLRLDFSGVRIGAGYVRITDEDPGAATDNAMADNIPAVESEWDHWDVGARYKMGPHSFRIGYLNVSKDSTPLETSAGIITYARTLGPGVTWSVDAMWADYEGQAGGDVDGGAITTGIKISF